MTHSISGTSLSCSAGAECPMGGFCLVAGRYSSNIHHIARIFLVALVLFLISVSKMRHFFLPGMLSRC